MNRLPPRRRRAVGLAVAVVGTAAVGVLGVLLAPGVWQEPPHLLLLLPVVAAAWFGGGRAGWAALALGLAIDGWHLLEHDGGDRVRLYAEFVLLAGVGGAVVLLFDRLHGAREHAEVRRQALQVTLDCIGDAVITTDAGGRVTRLNPLAESYTGWTTDQARGVPLTEVFVIVNESSRVPVDNPALRAMREGTVVGLANHTVLIARDGGERPIDDSAAPVRGADGAVLGCVLVFRDVTRRRDEAAAREEARRLYEDLYENAPDMMCSVDPADGMVVRCNATLARTLGMGKDDILGRPVFDLYHPSCRPQAHAAFQEFVATGTVENARLRLWRADRQPLDVSLKVSAVRDAAGKVLRSRSVWRDVSDLTAAETKLEGVRERLAATLAAGEIGTWDWDVAADRVHADANLAAMIGLDGAAVTGGPLAAYVRTVHPEDRQRVQDGIVAALDRDDGYGAEYRLVDADGTVRWVIARGRVQRDGSGAAVRLPGVVIDVTDRRNAELRLRESEATLAAVLDALPVGVIIADADGRLVRMNPANEALWGIAPHSTDMTGYGEWKGWWADGSQRRGRRLLAHEWAMARALRGTPTPLGNGDLVEIEPFGGSTATRRTILNTAAPIRDGDGTLVGAVVAQMDVTDRQRAARTSRFLADASSALAELADTQETLRRVADLAVPHFADWCAVDLLDADGRRRRVAVRHVDAGRQRLAEDMHRRWPPRPDDPAGIPHVLRSGAAQLVAEIDDALLAATAQDAEHLRTLRELDLGSLLCVPLTVQGRTRGAISFLAERGRRRYDGQDLRVARDLADRTAVALENDRLYAEQAEDARRKDEFLATLSHELRNPLAPIRAGLELLAQCDDDPVRREEVRAMMRRQTDQLVALIDDLLDVSRITRGKLELRRRRVPLADVVRDAVDATAPLLAAAGHAFVADVPEEPIVVDADPNRLTQAISNLLTNAARYTPDGGHVTLTVRRDGDAASVAVGDDGIGIAADQQDRVFDMFAQADRRADRASQGLGIGLTLVRSLMEMHGGSVAVASAGTGRGSTFTLRLPAAAARTAAPKAAPAAAAAAPSGDGCRVLVVDDSRAIRTVNSRLLERLGCEVRTACDGREAVEVAEEFRPRLVLMDIGLPLMDGYAAARAIRARDWGRDMRLIAVTGWGQEEDHRRTADAGFDRHLVKPVDWAVLRQAVAELDGTP